LSHAALPPPAWSQSFAVNPEVSQVPSSSANPCQTKPLLPIAPFWHLFPLTLETMPALACLKLDPSKKTVFVSQAHVDPAVSRAQTPSHTILAPPLDGADAHACPFVPAEQPHASFALTVGLDVSPEATFVVQHVLPPTQLPSAVPSKVLSHFFPFEQPQASPESPAVKPLLSESYMFVVHHDVQPPLP
jgi:hypothetical protein